MPNSAQAVEKEKEDFMTSKWRPMMAITYMATIIFDFILGPIMFNVLQYYNPGQAVTSWTPLTLQGGGLYHLAMGAILGISAWTRGQEKVAAINSGANNDPVPPAPVMNLPVGNTPQQTWSAPAQPTPAPVVSAPAVTAPASDAPFKPTPPPKPVF